MNMILSFDLETGSANIKQFCPAPFGAYLQYLCMQALSHFENWHDNMCVFYISQG